MLITINNNQLLSKNHVGRPLTYITLHLNSCKMGVIALV